MIKESQAFGGLVNDENEQNQATANSRNKDDAEENICQRPNDEM